MGGGSAVYLTVSVRDAGSSTRADDKGYAYGTADEQRIGNAHFYFYDADGNYRAQGSAAGADGSAGTTGNIEFKSNTVVAVWGIEDTSVPKYMVTVLNQPDDFEYGSTLGEMATALANGDCGWQDENGNFVMSTSSYVGYDDLSAETARPAYFVTEINEGDFRSEPVSLESDYAGDDAVQVYVERLAAKVQVDVALPDIEKNETYGYLIPAGPLGVSSVITKDGELENPLYIALNGWGLTGTARNSNAVKDITGLDVTSGIDGWTGWNDPGNFRSYWGKSYNYGKTDSPYPTSAVRDDGATTRGNTDADECGKDESLWLNKYLKYSSLSDALPFGEEACAYCPENTNTTEVLEKKTSSAITNVALKGQIGAYDKDADEFTPASLVMYNGQYYTVDAFKDYIAEKFMDTEAEEYAKFGFGESNWAFVKGFAEALDWGEFNRHLWVKKKNDSTADYEAFDGRFVKLMDRGEGNVSVRFEASAPEFCVNASGDSPFNPNEEYQKTYEMEGVSVSPATASLDDYDIYLRWDAPTSGTASAIWGAIRDYENVSVTYVGTYVYMTSSDVLYLMEMEDGNYCSYENGILDLMEDAVMAMNDIFADTEQSPMWPQFYQDGLMYYNAPIEHLNNEAGAMLEAQYGVVRNHWYKVTVEDVSQLGTPIANGESVIVPQDKDLQYLGASVNVLSWKVVEQSMSFTNQ